MPHKEVCLFGYWVIERGIGEFGKIYSGIKGQQAVDFLLQIKNGEVRSALEHPIIGKIDLIWGKENPLGYGLAKIVKKHPEVLPTLAESIKKSKILEEFPGRIVLLSDDGKQRAVVDLQWFETPKTWLMTAYTPL
jgi:hypothetical protein